MNQQESICPFHVGQMVAYTPSAHCLGHLANTEYAELLPGTIRRIVRIDQEVYLMIDGFENTSCGGIYWTEFSKGSD